MEDKDEGERITTKTEQATTMAHIAFADIRRGMRAIDIGCGTGDVTREIAKKVYPSQMIGFDISLDRVAASRLKDIETGLENLSYQNGTVYEMGFDDDVFDLAWARFLFEYLKEPLKGLLEIKRILKPGGRAVIGDLDGNCIYHYPISDSLNGKIERMLNFIGERAGFDPYVGRKLYHLFYQAGFQDIKVDIVPYHQIIGTASDKVFNDWMMKIEILKRNYYKLGGSGDNGMESAFDEFLDLLKRPDAITYSTAFFVQGIKPE